MREGLPVLVGERRYEVDVESITWRTIPPTRQGSDQGAGPGEQSLSLENIWRRTRGSWILGAGQDFADEIEESDPRRFRSSDGINPWDVRSLTPLNTVEQKRASANTNLAMVVARVATTDYLVVLDGNTAYYSSDPTATSPTFTAFTGITGTLTSIATDGRRCWVASGADIYLGTPGTAAASVFSTYDATLVGYANGRLLAANGAELVEISAAGASTVLFTHANANFTWKGIVTSPGGIYVFGDSGDRSEVFVITAIDTTGALDVPFVAMETPDGEYLRAMCFYGGVMVLATSRGIRLALITGGGFLSFGPVVEEPGDVRCLEPQGEDVWFGWTYTAAINGLGRARLSRFTSQLVPAFATDLMARGTVSGDVLSAATVGTRRYFAISGRGFYGETTTLEATSTIDLGWFDYGISEPKSLDSLTVWCDALPATCKIVANVYGDDDTDALLTMAISKGDTRKQTAGYEGNVEAERLRVVLTITQAGATPVTVRRVTLRAAPRPFISDLITLPLFLSDAVQSSTGQQTGQDPYAEFLYLQGLRTNRTRVPLAVGDWTAEARIEAVEVEKGGLGGGNGLEGWADKRKFVAGKWEVTFVTVEPDA